VENIAAATTACQGVWLTRLVTDMAGVEPGAPELMVDNQSAIALSKNPVYHERSKHVDTKFHYICECTEGNRIVLGHISTEKQLVDILTKELGRVRFLEQCELIGVTAIGGEGMN
jgi:hypothetical protein